MLLKVIDKLLDRSFPKEPDYNRLDRLEGDVWAIIKETASPKNAISFMFPVWENKQLRYACLSLALILGILMARPPFQPPPRADILGLEVFSPYASFLITSLIEQPDPAPS